MQVEIKSEVFEATPVLFAKPSLTTLIGRGPIVLDFLPSPRTSSVQVKLAISLYRECDFQSYQRRQSESYQRQTIIGFNSYQCWRALDFNSAHSGACVCTIKTVVVRLSPSCGPGRP
jgi:hypothetical protein